MRIAEIVSVVIPTYNAPEICADTVRSVLADQMTVEVLVVDDGSTDENRRRLEYLLKGLSSEVSTREGGDGEPIIRYRWQPNTGAYLARLNGVSAADGAFVKFLDHDDRLILGVLAKEIEIAKARGADVVMTDWHQGERKDGSSNVLVTQRHRAPEYENPLTDFLEKGGVYTGAALYRRTLCENIKPITTWRPRLKDDWAIFGQICLNNSGKRFVTLHETSYVWIHHRNQQTAEARLDSNIAEIYQFLGWFDGELEERGKLIGRRRCAMARYYMKNAILLCQQDRLAWCRVAQRIRALCPNERITVGNRLSTLAINLFGIEGGVRSYVRAKRLIRSV